MDIRPIRTDRDHRAALAEIERLWGASEGSDDMAKLDILTTLVGHYEDERWPTTEPKWTPVDVLHYAIAEMGHSQSELGDVLGSRSRASEVLARKRPLTLEMVRLICHAWKLPAELLIAAYEIRTPKRKAARKKREYKISFAPSHARPTGSPMRITGLRARMKKAPTR
jgi:HTH-type transcriptional regulator/antitoxin HigA